MIETGYVAPLTLAETFDALAMPGARCLAGGQSLVAMMNLGLVTPPRLVSLRHISDLRGVTRQVDGSTRIGAMTTHTELASLRSPDAGLRLLASAAQVIAYPAIRAWGTIGGSVALADPAADYPAVLVALNASVEAASRRGTRSITATEFFRDVFATALATDEIVTAITLPPSEPGARSAYEKLSLVAGDFGILTVAAIAGTSTRIAVGGCGPTPVLLANADAARTIAPAGDQRASAQYRRRVLPGLVNRVLERCRSH